jgi:uncharacterized protein
VQHPDRSGVGNEHRNFKAAQGKCIAFDESAVGQRRDPGRGGERCGAGHADHGFTLTTRAPHARIFGIRRRAVCRDERTGSVRLGMPELKARLRADLNTAMKARDELTTATLRMALTAVSTEEVSGKQSRELTDDEVLRVVGREAKKRREAAEAFDAAGRTELAARERAEGSVLGSYLPKQLGDAELTELVGVAVAESGASGPQQMGAVMKLVQPRVAGRADGKRVSDEVRRQLAALS